MAQPPLSRQIRLLERELGVELVERGHHVVGLTDAGRSFLRSARLVLGELDRATQHARRAARGEIGTLVIGYVSEVTADLLPLGLRGYKDRFPEVELELQEARTSDVIDGVRRGQVDVGFVRSPASANGLESEALIKETMLLAIPAGHQDGERRARLTELREENLIMPSARGFGLRRDIEQACREAGFEPRVVREADSLTAILLLIAAKLGVALVPASAAHMYPVPGVHYVAISDPAPATTAGLVWRPNEPSHLVQNFIEVVREVAREHKGEMDVWPERRVVDIDQPED